MFFEMFLKDIVLLEEILWLVYVELYLIIRLLLFVLKVCLNELV